MHLFISSLDKINSILLKLIFIANFDTNPIIFSFIGLLLFFSSLLPYKYCIKLLSSYKFSKIFFSSSDNSFFSSSSSFFPPKKNENALDSTFPFLPSNTLFSTFNFVAFNKFIFVGIINFSISLLLSTYFFDIFS